MYNILVVGAGYLGTQIARDFAARKQRVFALTRSLEKAKRLEVDGIQPLVADLLKPETLSAIPEAHFIVLCVAPDERSEEAYLKTYVDGIRNFLESRKARSRPYLIVHVSSTSVWKDSTLGSEIDETYPADNDAPLSRILLASESLTQNSGFPSVIYRLSGIYGPCRNRLKVFCSGAWPLHEHKDHYMNMIHVRDAAESVLTLFKSGKEGELYIGTDDVPVLRSEFCAWLTKETGFKKELPTFSHEPSGKKLKNQKLRNLGFVFSYPSFKEGYQGLLKSEINS